LKKNRKIAVSQPRGRPPTTLDVRKLECLRYHVAFLRDFTFNRVDTIPACDRHTQTDRQTNTHIASVARVKSARFVCLDKLSVLG